MKVLMVASEAAPFLRTSDVANVVVELCSELRKEGHDVRLAIPFYRHVASAATARQIVTEFDVRLGMYRRKASIWQFDHELESGGSIPIYLVKDEFYFGRESPYGYIDDYERFIFFTRAILQMLDTPEWTGTENPWRPDVIHGHDWIAGLLPFWLRTPPLNQTLLPPIAFAYTIHNAGFPGQFEHRALLVAGLEKLGVYGELGESADMVSFMARGVWAADAVNTVSPTHADELNRGTYPSGLARAISHRKEALEGILNGIDYSRYNPAFDPHIKHHFDAFTLHNRTRKKL